MDEIEMTTFPGSPKLIKGAIIGFDIFNPVASVIVFQYNPTQVSRQVQINAAEQGGSPTEVLRLAGAPRETITLNEVIIDATDQLEQADDTAVDIGIYPQLSALEMLLYPKSAVVIANTVLMATGTIEVVQPAAPFTLFVWGAKRVVPVRLNSFTITEEQFDTKLNPTRARISSLALQVLSYNDFPLIHPGYHAFLAHQVVKEAMAITGSVSDLSAVAGGEIGL
jgi:hypothetical protein